MGKSHLNRRWLSVQGIQPWLSCHLYKLITGLLMTKIVFNNKYINEINKMTFNAKFNIGYLQLNEWHWSSDKIWNLKNLDKIGNFRIETTLEILKIGTKLWQNWKF
jgi:hypothetical protein